MSLHSTDTDTDYGRAHEVLAAHVARLQDAPTPYATELAALRRIMTYVEHLDRPETVRPALTTLALV